VQKNVQLSLATLYVILYRLPAIGGVTYLVFCGCSLISELYVVFCVLLYVGWWRGTVVERRSLAGELSLSCARPAADG